MRVASHLFALF